MDINLNYSIEDRDGLKVLHVIGDISNVTKDEFVTVVNRITQKNNVVINMRDINIITSSGMDAIVNISTNARQKGKRVFIMGLKSSFLKIIDTLDIHEYFIFVDSIEEAQMKLRYYT